MRALPPAVALAALAAPGRRPRPPRSPTARAGRPRTSAARPPSHGRFAPRRLRATRSWRPTTARTSTRTPTRPTPHAASARSGSDMRQTSTLQDGRLRLGHLRLARAHRDRLRGRVRPTLVIMDPNSLDTLAEMPLPTASPAPTRSRTSPAAATSTSTTATARSFPPPTGDPGRLRRQERRARPTTSAARCPPGDGVISALPDWSGRIWFATKSGVVGWVDPEHRRGAQPRAGRADRQLLRGRRAERRLHRQRRRAVPLRGRAAVGVRTVWREGYANTGVKKPGQTQVGSGTTPTLFGHGLVAITDNADPIRIVVMRRGRTTGGRPRTVCAVPVFDRAPSSDRPVADRCQPLADRGEQLRLHRAAVDRAGPHHAAGARASRRPARPQRLPQDLALDRDARRRWCRRSRWTPGLVYTYTKPGGRPRRPLVPHSPRLPHRAHACGSRLAGYGLGSQQQLRAGHHRPRQRHRLRGRAGRADRPARRDARRSFRAPPRLVARPLRQPPRPWRGSSGIDEPLVLRARIAVRQAPAPTAARLPRRWKLRRTPRRVRVRIVARLRDGRLPRRTKTVRCSRVTRRRSYYDLEARQPLGLFLAGLELGHLGVLGPAAAQVDHRLHGVRSPSNTASTVPSSRFLTQPATPRRSASLLTVSRKNTPCTRPWATTLLRILSLAHESTVPGARASPTRCSRRAPGGLPGPVAGGRARSARSRRTAFRPASAAA